MKNDTAKTANEASKEAAGSSDGKNWLPMITAKNPYTEKSYHSMKFPIAPAATAFLAAAGSTCAATVSPFPLGLPRSPVLIVNFRPNILAGPDE